MLGRLLQDELRKRDLSYREAADQIKVSHQTISRILKGERMDMPTIVKVCSWLGINVSNVIDTYGDTNYALSAKIVAILEIYPVLKKVFEETIKRIEDGRATPELLREIVSYANYKFSEQDMEIQEAKKNHPKNN